MNNSSELGNFIDENYVSEFLLNASINPDQSQQILSQLENYPGFGTILIVYISIIQIRV